MTSAPFDLPVPCAVDRIRKLNESINAFASTRLDAALSEASKRGTEPKSSPLYGVPFSLKDEWETTCLPTTGGSYRHRNRLPAHDSAVFQAFHDAGAVLLGKSNLSDLGLAPEANNHIVGPTRNPWDLRRTAGGSSGGAAAAVAAGMVAFDWGTDIGGSVRQPAAFCGVLGMRLSSETWPLRDSFPFVPAPVRWMCGQGPLTRTAAQMRAVLDAASSRLQTGPTRAFAARTATLFAPAHLGSWSSFYTDVTPHVESALGCGIRRNHGLAKATHIRNVYSSLWASNFEALVEADPTLPLGRGLVAALSAMLFGAARGDFRLHRDCAELLLLMALGRVTVFRNRSRAQANADALADSIRELWDAGCIVVAPVSTQPAPLHGHGNRDHAQVMCCTALGNIADATSLSVPFGYFGSMPRAVQLMGPPGSEREILDIADRLIASRDRDPALVPRPFPLDNREPLPDRSGSAR